MIPSETILSKSIDTSDDEDDKNKDEEDRQEMTIGLEVEPEGSRRDPATTTEGVVPPTESNWTESTGFEENEGEETTEDNDGDDVDTNITSNDVDERSIGEYASSLYHGVERGDERESWKAYDSVDKRTRRLIGHFRTEEDAARAHDLQAYLMHGVSAVLNFGIPQRFLRAEGNVMFVPGPNKWFMRFKNSSYNVAVGYFHSADAALSAHTVANKAYNTGHLDGLNRFRSFLFEMCFEGTAIAPWAKSPKRAKKSKGNKYDPGIPQDTLCMSCSKGIATCITLPCRHVRVCDLCKNSFERPPHCRQSKDGRTVIVNLKCPCCLFPCILSRSPNVTPVDHGIHTNLAENRAPLFKFPREVRNVDGLILVSDNSFRVGDKETPSAFKRRRTDKHTKEAKGPSVVLPEKNSTAHVVRPRKKVFSNKDAVIKSAFRGVCWDTRKRKWKAQIGHLGETIYLGHHGTETSAALRYDEAARGLHGSRARTNFDPSGYRTKHLGNRSDGSGYKKI